MNELGRSRGAGREPAARQRAPHVVNTPLASIGVAVVSVAVSLLADASASALQGQPVRSPLSISAADSWASGFLVLVFVYPLLRRRRRAIEQETELRIANVKLAEYRRRDDAEQEKRRTVTAAVQRCLEDRALSIVFQPIVSTHDGRVIGAEALARFPDGRPPDEWFNAAAEVGLGVELELLAVELAIAEATALIPDEIYVSVNVSPATMTSPNICALLESAPRPLVVEMTEHAPMETSDALTAALQWARRQGVRVAADDAGNGYAGLSHLLRLAPDIIKLDRDLVTGVDADPAKRALVMAVTGFAADIGATVVAEGVETTRELQALVTAGVTAVQGFLLGRPSPAPLESTTYAGLGSPAVVVVDDDPTVRQTLAAILRRSGFEVVAEASDGAAAVTSVSMHRPAAVILDFVLPTMMGSEVLERIRSTSPESVVIGFSAASSAEFRLAVDGFLSKGDADALAELPGFVRDCINRRRQSATQRRRSGQTARERPSLPHRTPSDYAPRATGHEDAGDTGVADHPVLSDEPEPPPPTNLSGAD